MERQGEPKKPVAETGEETPSKRRLGFMGLIRGEKHKKTQEDVDYTRSWTGLWVVIFGDIAIAMAAIFGVLNISGKDGELFVSILTSAFTAIGTMTTAYFGIRAVSVTAERKLHD